MTIIFKKSVAFLFLFTQVFASSTGRSSRRSNRSTSSGNAPVTRSKSRGSPLNDAGTINGASPQGVADYLSPTTTDASQTISPAELDSFRLWHNVFGENDVEGDGEGGLADLDEKLSDEIELSRNPLKRSKQETPRENATVLLQDGPIKQLLSAISSRNIDAVREIVLGGIDINALSESTGKSPFMHALITGDQEIVAFLMNTGKVDPNIVSRENVDVFSLAFEKFGINLVRKLLVLPVKLSAVSALRIIFRAVDAKKPYAFPLISAMAETRQQDIIKALIVMTKDAVQMENLGLLKYLHSIGIPLTARFEGGMNLAHYAAIRGNNEILGFLIDAGHVDINALTRFSSLSPLSIAYINLQCNTVMYLMQKGARAGLDTCAALAISENNLPVLGTIISAYNDIDKIIIQDGYNMLTFAVLADNVPALRMLLDSKKINPETVDAAGRTILTMEIPEFASEALAELLICERFSVPLEDDF